MRKKERTKLSAARAAEIFKEIVSVRRNYCRDAEFFTMPDLLDFFAEDVDPDFKFKLKFYGKYPSNDFNKKASVVSFVGRATMVMHRGLFMAAKKRCKFSNFTLAHEFVHLILGHHSTAALVKNFALTETEKGMSVFPDTDEEKETDFGAVFFLCGVRLLDESIEASHLARIACCDQAMVERALRICKLSVFRQELHKVFENTPRVVL